MVHELCIENKPKKKTTPLECANKVRTSYYNRLNEKEEKKKGHASILYEKRESRHDFVMSDKEGRTVRKVSNEHVREGGRKQVRSSDSVQ